MTYSHSKNMFRQSILANLSLCAAGLLLAIVSIIGGRYLGVDDARTAIPVGVALLTSFLSLLAIILKPI